MLASFLTWHHRLGVLTCLALLLWGLSGVMHPLMSRWQPRPATPMPPDQAVDLTNARPLPAILKQHGWPTVQGASLVTLGGQAHYRITLTPNEPAQYVQAYTGETTPDGERLHAEELARHYTGLHDSILHDTRIVSISRIMQFDEDYHPTNRLLPVWRVQFDRADGLTAYIDTDQARLATLVDAQRRGLTQWFRFGHDWSFLEEHPGSRLVLMTAGLVLAVFSAASGLWFFVRMRRSASTRLARKPMARWHRWSGAAIGLSTITFACSGAFHLWMGERRDALAVPSVAPMSVAANQLSEQGWRASVQGVKIARLQLLAQAGQSAWLVQPARAGQASGPAAQVGMQLGIQGGAHARDEHAGHTGHADLAKQAKSAPSSSSAAPTRLHDTSTGELVTGGIEAWSASLAQGFAAVDQAGASIKVIDTAWVTRFGDEYGFINKRLPVVRVQMQDAGNTRYYIEPATGTLAARVDDLDALEGRVFSWLHKWRFFPDTAKDTRDAAQAAVALANVGVAAVGVWLFMKKRRRPAGRRP